MLRNEEGLTLVEIMIVLAILAGLAAILGTTVFGALDKANVRQAKIQMGTIAGKLDEYSADCGIYPTTDQGLEALINAPEVAPTCDDWGPTAYFKKLPKDPWKNDYVYESDGSTYTLYSLGKDRKEEGEGYNKDIYYE